MNFPVSYQYSIHSANLNKFSALQTINDVALGITQAGLSRYMNRIYGQPSIFILFYICLMIRSSSEFLDKHVMSYVVNARKWKPLIRPIIWIKYFCLHDWFSLHFKLWSGDRSVHIKVILIALGRWE